MQISEGKCRAPVRLLPSDNEGRLSYLSVESRRLQKVSEILASTKKLCIFAKVHSDITVCGHSASRIGVAVRPLLERVFDQNIIYSEVMSTVVFFGKRIPTKKTLWMALQSVKGLGPTLSLQESLS